VRSPSSAVLPTLIQRNIYCSSCNYNQDHHG
jgi:hypothetical protein